MEILKGIIADNLFLYLKEHKAFILSDLHIGYEESLNRKGILVPRNNYGDLMVKIEKSLEKIKKNYIIEQIVINGDLLHEFGKISITEKDSTQKLLKFLQNYGKLTVIEGNHDKILKYIVDGDTKITNHVFFGTVLVIHGDTLVPKDFLKRCNTIIIGHEHPAVTLKTSTRTEKYKCFLKGRYETKDLIVTPSCNLFLEGTDVLEEKHLSPILRKSNISNFEVYIVEDEIYDFGKLKKLQNI